MAYVADCPDHPDCDLIVSDGWPDQPGAWASHFENDVSPESRLNPDDPEQESIEDRRSSTATNALARRAPTQDERDRLDGRLTREGRWLGPVDVDGNRVRGGHEVRRSNG